MLARELPPSQKFLAVASQRLEVILAEEGNTQVAVPIPPLDELAEIEAYRATNISASEIVDGFEAERSLMFRSELATEMAMADRYASSPTYLSRLASLAEGAGNSEQAIQLLDRARQLSTDPFYAHKQIDQLALRGKSDDARKMLQQLSLDSDVYANLKLAVFDVQRGNIDAASVAVAKAVDIDPTDFSARLFEGGLRLLSGDFEGAIHSFRLAAADRPTSSALYTNVAVAYLKLKLPHKAFASLKQAVALGPVNARAIYLLADVAFSLGADADAIPALRYLMHFEQKEAAGWARLARACLQIGNIPETITALQRQAGVEESSSVYNNLGVAHALRGDQPRALQWFQQAMAIGTGKWDRGYFLAARNVAQALIAAGAYEKVISFTTAVAAKDLKGLCVSADDVSDLYACHMHALRNLNRADDLRVTAHDILMDPRAAIPLKLWTISTLVGYEALEEVNSPRVKALIGAWGEWALGSPPQYLAPRQMAINNIAFALADQGDVVGAEHYLVHVTRAVGIEAYATATRGLISVRKGHFERGVRQYRDAVRLARTRGDKVRIRQKLQFETARHLVASNPKRAYELLRAVASIKDGEKALAEQARIALRILPVMPDKPAS